MRSARAGIAPSTAFATALLAACSRAGVRDVVVSPGSRSQALALAAAALDRAGALRLHVRIDERSGGFLALGIAKESGRPVVVVTTSGTAVANLHPAVLEAHHSGVPLVVVTADRPEEMRGVGANQTTTHVGMFGDAVRRTWDVGAPTGEAGEPDVAAAIAAAVVRIAAGDGNENAAGPVHLNVAFVEPLSGGALDPSAVVDPVEVSDASAMLATGPIDAPSSLTLELAAGPRTVVIAGSGAGSRAEELARQLGAVLFAEVVSGAHFGPNLVVPYREVARDDAFLAALERVVVVGRPTLSREVPWLIERGDAETIVMRGPGADAYNPGRSVGAFCDAITVTGPADPATARSWVGPWVAFSRAMLAESDEQPPEVFAGAGDKARRELDAVRRPVTHRALVEAVWRASWPHDRLVVASSRLVRELDRYAAGKAIPVHANRGLAGIDGNTSVAVGVALVSGAVTRLLTGDLAFLHDVGGLALADGEERPHIMVVVGNDGGGTIFDGLEVAEQAGEDFDRVMLARQSVSIEDVARAYGWEYRRADTRGELDPALSACTGPTVVEVPLPR